MQHILQLNWLTGIMPAAPGRSCTITKQLLPTWGKHSQRNMTGCRPVEACSPHLCFATCGGKRAHIGIYVTVLIPVQGMHSMLHRDQKLNWNNSSPFQGSCKCFFGTSSVLSFGLNCQCLCQHGKPLHNLQLRHANHLPALFTFDYTSYGMIHNVCALTSRCFNDSLCEVWTLQKAFSKASWRLQQGFMNWSPDSLNMTHVNTGQESNDKHHRSHVVSQVINKTYQLSCIWTGHSELCIHND